MTNDLKDQAEDLRRLSSEDAATWLMEQYPIEDPEYWKAIDLLIHRSWKRSDQIRLARYYLSKIPFAMNKPYEAFASFMSLSNFVNVLREKIPKDKGERQLLLYHLEPTLKKKVKSDLDMKIVQDLLSELEK